MKLLYSGLISLLILSFSACSSLSMFDASLIYDKERRSKHFAPKTDIYINYKELASNAVKTIFLNGKIPNKIMVTDFVDITSLDNHSKLGYVLSNNIKDAMINKYKANIIEAEVSKYFKISGNGLKILSRDIDKLRSTNFEVSNAVVGTYTYTNEELIVFVKLIDLKTGFIKGSYAITLPMGNGTRMLLSTE